MKKNKRKYKLEILDQEYDLIVSTIKSDNKVIWLDEIKDNKLKLLISDKLGVDLDKFLGLEIKREGENRSINIIGTNIDLFIKKAVKLNINKKIFFIEELNNDKHNYTITFSSSFVEDMTKINKIKIHSI